MFNSNQSSVKKYPDPIQIPPHKISKETYKNNGTYGIIYLGTYDNVTIVVKKPKIDTGFISNEEAYEAFFCEFQFLKESFHRQSEYIVKLIGYNIVGSFLVLEYMNQGDLQCFLKNNCSIPWDVKISLLSDAGYGLKELHSHKYPYAHNDIKITNILVSSHSSSYRAKLADFGTVYGVDMEDKNGNSRLQKDVLSYVAVIGDVAELRGDNSESTSSQKNQEEVPKPISTLLAKFGYRASGSRSETKNICVQNVLDCLNEAKIELLNLKK